jgi:hypothetical protein
MIKAFLLLFLLTATVFAQNNLDYEVRGKSVDFTFSTDEVEYASDLAPLTVVLQADSKQRKETIASAKAFDIDFTLQLQKGIYKVIIYSKTQTVLLESVIEIK